VEGRLKGADAFRTRRSSQRCNRAWLQRSCHRLTPPDPLTPHTGAGRQHLRGDQQRSGASWQPGRLVITAIGLGQMQGSAACAALHGRRHRLAAHSTALTGASRSGDAMKRAPEGFHLLPGGPPARRPLTTAPRRRRVATAGKPPPGAQHQSLAAGPVAGRRHQHGERSDRVRPRRQQHAL